MSVPKIERQNPMDAHRSIEAFDSNPIVNNTRLGRFAYRLLISVFAASFVSIALNLTPFRALVHRIAFTLCGLIR